MSNQKALDYQAMLDEYLQLRDQVNDLYASGEPLDDDVYDRLDELKNMITEYNKKYLYSIHYVIPDNEFTKH